MEIDVQVSITLNIHARLKGAMNSACSPSRAWATAALASKRLSEIMRVEIIPSTNTASEV